MIIDLGCVSNLHRCLGALVKITYDMSLSCFQLISMNTTDNLYKTNFYLII